MGAYAGPKRKSTNLKYCFDAANSNCYTGSNNLKNAGGSGTGTMVNTTVGSDGVACFQFNGTNAYVSSDVDVSFDEATHFTLLVWAKTNVISQGGGIVGKPNPGWEWGFRQGSSNVGANASGGTLFVQWNTGGGHSNIPISYSATGFDNTTTWYHFAVVSDGSTIKMYKNGSLYDTRTYADASINQDRTNGVQLGGNIYAWGETWWNGKLGSTNILQTPFTAVEIKEDFDNTKSRYGL